MVSAAGNNSSASSSSNDIFNTPPANPIGLPAQPSTEPSGAGVSEAVASKPSADALVQMGNAVQGSAESDCVVVESVIEVPESAHVHDHKVDDVGNACGLDSSAKECEPVINVPESAPNEANA
eukprot:7352293-Karenia_brevis.AAC.1